MPAATRPSDAERRQHPAGRQQQLGEQQDEADQGDDDEGFHRLDYPPFSA